MKKVFLISCLCILFCISCKGEQKPMMVSQGGYNYHPTISPDGKYVAYLHEVDNVLGAVGNPWLFDVRTGTRTQLNNHQVFELFDGYPQWSKNSEEVVYSSNGAIFIYNVIQDSVTSILKSESDTISFFAPSINTAGDMIAFHCMYSIDTVTYWNLWTWKRSTNVVDELASWPYYFPNETPTFQPLWVKGDTTIVCAYFLSAEETDVGEICLALVNLRTRQWKTLANGLRGAYFRVSGEMAHFKRWSNGKESVYSVDLRSGQIDSLGIQCDNYFDAVVVDQGFRLFYSENGYLHTLKGNIVDSSNCQGINPQIGENLILLEQSLLIKDSVTNKIILLPSETCDGVQ